MPEIVYSNVKHLDKLQVLKDEHPSVFGESTYFKVSKFPEILTYGTHTFLLAIKVPENNKLAYNSTVDFEFKDSEGTVIYSDTTTHGTVNGAAVLYVDVKQDPTRTYKNIQSGYGTLTIVGEMSDVPTEWQGKPNYRVQWPIQIIPDSPNISPIVFKKTPQITASIGPLQGLVTEYDILNNSDTSIIIEMNELETYGGQVRYAEISQRPANLDTGSTQEYTPIVTLDLFATSSVPVDKSFSLVPASGSHNHTYARLIYPDSVIDGPPRQDIEYKVKFLNPDKIVAQHLTSSNDIEAINSLTYQNQVLTIQKDTIQGVHIVSSRSGSVPITSTQYGLRLELTNTTSSGVGARTAFANTFPSIANIQTPLFTRIAPPSASNPAAGVYAIFAEGRTQLNDDNNTGSLWSGRFAGADVKIDKNLAIGSFGVTEHPKAALHVKGDIMAENYIVSSSVTHLITQTLSGSTSFGDSIDDTHKFTGSLFYSSSAIATPYMSPDAALTVNGMISASNISLPNNSYLYIDPFGANSIKLWHINKQIAYYSGSYPCMVFNLDHATTGERGKVHVGLGVQQPSEVLDIHGSIRVSGSNTGHITASGKISSSGNITAPKFYIQEGKESYLGSNDSGDDLSLIAADDIRIKPTDDILIYHGSTNYARFDGVNKGLWIDGDITASGNISASGYLMGDQIKSNGVKVARYRTDLGLTRFGSANYPTVITGSKSITIGESPETHITASGNISGSVNLYVSESIKIGTNENRANLHVADASAPRFRLSRTGTGQIWQQEIDSSGRWQLKEAASEGGTQYLRLQIDDTGHMHLAPDAGNVSIGSSAVDDPPTEKLVVEGNISASGEIHAFSHITSSGNILASSEDARIRVQATSGNHPGYEWLEGTTRKWLIFNDPANDHMTWKNASDTELMELDQDGQLYVSKQIFHMGDTDTYIDFTDDDINIQAGGVNMVDFTEGGTNEITFNEGAADLDVRIEGASDANLLFTNAGTDRVGIGKNNPTKKLEVAGAISSSGNVHINVGSNPKIDMGRNVAGSMDGIAVKGDISGSGNLYAKTYRSERLYVYGSVNDGEEYYFTIGGNPYDSAVANANVAPSPPLTQTAMCDLKIIRLKLNTATSTSGVSTVKIYCRKWDGSNAFDNNLYWENVGTAWTVKSGNLVDNERFYHAPSDWTISAGEIWGLQIEVNGNSAVLHINGGIVTEENWNTLISS